MVRDEARGNQCPFRLNVYIQLPPPDPKPVGRLLSLDKGTQSRRLPPSSS